ncbi:acyl-CoA synthetase [Alcaligenes nematophilus]|uniref:Acyl-CoA synthetase n=1 Tax=Alcaligenes nematophilus TaxID=2994643 RepID=A0ABU3MSM0_9BURK|nr:MULTISPECIES: acyl-CoA synthetase [Alcaligenes]MDT8465557.1 acyl-CoA synthetase [Alcaligenes nematophilus]MDT8470393.1 acyl-CoA synthetase [Alcaligenes nematophilus]MDT8504285.1 acyl-CoA synthetase [Alcaligenes nematophilus]MDT8525284.1 acyl-CoA synthetase [Alcaligenes nematophilus]
MVSIYDQDLPQTDANYRVLSPLDFIERSAFVYPDYPALVYGPAQNGIKMSWSQLYARTRQLGSALSKAGVGKGDTVAVMLPNTPPMVQAHFGVPMCGAVLNTLNTRLDASTIAYMLDHGEARAVLVDSEFAAVMKEALSLRESKEPILVIDVVDNYFDTGAERIGSQTYEEFVDEGDPDYDWQLPANEWDAIALNYTSGTTGKPKGVVYHHRGAYLGALSNVLEWDMPKHAVYLWTLPMFHCNGWTFPWVIAARAGVNVCLRKVEAQAMVDNMVDYGVTHYCGAPIVHSLLVNSDEALKSRLPKGVSAMVAGAAPPATMIEGMERMGFALTHVYGLTETYGPASVCAQHAPWSELDIQERAQRNARQGVRYHLQGGVQVLNPQTMEPVPADGETMGEIMFRGNITMKGYLKNAQATQESLGGGWFHTGDLAVCEPDGYVRIKDRSKDIIISGGENISSIEIEDVMYRHPAVQAAAVVAQPDERWGEAPHVYVELRPGAEVTVEELRAHCRQYLAGFKIPRHFSFMELPKTATGKIQKFALRQQAKQAASD